MLDLSFVIPYYNKAKTLQKTLDSLFDQSVKNIEVILVLDGPSKEARDIAKKFKKKPLQVIEIPHGGACAARNAGRELAKGKYISFWDADSYIEPGAAAVWLQAFDQNPNVDFVYSGYRFPEGKWAISGHPFDPWTLKAGNYISAMFPIKREKCPVWDVNLKSLQDWDFWLTAVDNGCIGMYLRGYAFVTEDPDEASISGQGTKKGVWLDRVRAVKEKHNIPNRDACVSCFQNREYGVHLAKILDWDYRDMPTHLEHEYKTILQVGFHPRNADTHAKVFQDKETEVRKILFWRGEDVAFLRRFVSSASSDALALLLNRSASFQFCEDKFTRQTLAKAGFNVEILPLPMEVTTAPAPLPEKMRLLVDIEGEYSDFFASIMRACPDIGFTKFEGAKNVDDFHGMIQLLTDRTVGVITKKVLLSGRYLISNIQAPYCGFVSDTQPVEGLRSEIIRKIREIQKAAEPDIAGATFYAAECSPEKFKTLLTENTSPMAKKELAEVA